MWDGMKVPLRLKGPLFYSLKPCVVELSPSGSFL